MPKKPTPLSINLLPGKEASFGEKFLTWSLTFGRYIIIGTEIIVLIAFLSRFKLDRDLVDLNDQIRDKQNVLATLKPIEESVTRLQRRLLEIKRIEATQGKGIVTLPEIGLLTPRTITYTQITVSGDKLTIVGKALETAHIAQFTAALKESNLFEKESISLEKIERTKPEDETLTFTIAAVAQKEAE